jgi:methylthioribulose 1-phosphate dehydratase/enolase-phosphatase E1
VLSIHHHHHPAGVYVWGKDWIQAKTQAECYDYLFEAAVKMAQLGINASVAPPPPLITANGAAAEGKRHAENGVSAGVLRLVIRK